ncbi:MAG: PKD domain-containing protein [Bacteroidota bacterium]|nr:PKD domain-containing protein [Bacteroidota bacterium]
MNKIVCFLIFPFVINAQTAFISGNDTICDNSQDGAEVSISFSGVSPFTFSFAIDGIIQPPIPPTTINPYIINTKIAGNYTLVSYNDATSFGSISGSGLVTVLESPTALIHLETDTLFMIYPMANFISQSIGNIINWNWNFGDNTTNEFSENVSHLYKDSSAIYQVNLIVTADNGCFDTATTNIWVRDKFWIYIPNTFSPDYDGINDRFCIEYNGIRENTFLFKVFNAQGALMFQSTNPSSLRCSTGGGWAGKYFENNMDLPLDTYAYEIYFQDFEGWKHQKYGTLHLVR